MEQQIQSTPRPFNAAKFVFFYLTHLVSLVFMSVAFGTIIFQAINKKISDPLNLYSAIYNSGFMKFGIAALLVFTPIFYIVSRFIFKAVRQGEIKRDSGIRRWLTYLILFVSFLVFAGYLTSFVFNFLDGELTLKFILKTITVLAIAATIFSFYFYDISRKQTEGRVSKVVRIYFFSTLFAIIVVFIGSFFVVDNPFLERAKKMDDDILNKFNTIDNCVEIYYKENKIMPESMEEIKSECPYISEKAIVDENTGKFFEYHLKQDRTYELCAEFYASNRDEEDSRRNYVYYSSDSESFLHDAGWQCLERKIYSSDLK
jgi:hypothetical protein